MEATLLVKIESNLSGKTFGKFLVIKKVDSYKHKSNGRVTCRARYECLCECGRIQIVDAIKLRSGKRSQCINCSYKERPQSKSNLSNEQRLFNLSIIQRCKGKDIKIDLTLEEFKDIIDKNCYYCGCKPKLKNYLNCNRIVKKGELYANGIDRLDSNKGYNIENCVPCCKICNIMKSTLSEEEFISHIKKIIDNYGISKEVR